MCCSNAHALRRIDFQLRNHAVKHGAGDLCLNATQHKGEVCDSRLLETVKRRYQRLAHGLRQPVFVAVDDKGVHGIRNVAVLDFLQYQCTGVFQRVETFIVTEAVIHCETQGFTGNDLCSTAPPLHLRKGIGGFHVALVGHVVVSYRIHPVGWIFIVNQRTGQGRIVIGTDSFFR